MNIPDCPSSVAGKDESRIQSQSDLDGVGSIHAIPNVRKVPSLLCHERFNEVRLPEYFGLDRQLALLNLNIGRNSATEYIGLYLILRSNGAAAQQPPLFLNHKYNLI